MRKVRHPVWRAASILALLLVTQFAYAAQLCLSATAFGVSAHAMGAGPSGESSQSAGPDCAADPGCATAMPASEICIASRYEAGVGMVAATPAFDAPSVPAASGGTQWGVASPPERVLPPKLAATPQPPLRTLLCRYLV